MRHLLGSLSLIALSALGSGAVAQDVPDPTTPTDPQPDPQPAAAPATATALDSRVLLGRRAGMALASRRVIPTVVIVPDPASYADAISFWTPEVIYPVLLDDGSWPAAEDIARFVRGFRPDSVVRWEAEGKGSRAGAPMRPRRAVPKARELAETALARAWGVETGAPDPTRTLITRLIALERPSPGIIIADERDPAWTAALALAAGRGEPIMWTELPKLAIDGPMSAEEAEALAALSEQFCADTQLPWRELGDVLDAVTICASLPARIQVSPDEFVATTDRLGRLSAEERWGWAGQIFGSEPTAAYRAMCSLFLRMQSAWLFDGYGSGEPWIRWDATAAAAPLQEAGLFTMLDDEPRNTLADWRLRAERPVHADVILLNSSGNRSWFDLAGSRAQAGDVPLLDVPSAVHMVHSWSAVAPGRRATVAGRWFERGVYAYVGSVHEPYLQAFVPTPILAQRLVAGMALGAAARLDSGPIWRIAVLADPLLAYGPDAERISQELPLGGDTSLDDELKSAATDLRYADTLTALSLLGRDSDAARLFGALLRDKPEAITPGLARAALFALFRTGQDDAFLRAYAALSPEDAAHGPAVDALWHVGRRVVREGGSLREAAITLMSARQREEQAEADAAELLQLGAGRR